MLAKLKEKASAGLEQRYQKQLELMPRRQREAHRAHHRWQLEARDKIKQMKQLGEPIDPLYRKMAYAPVHIILADSDPRRPVEATAPGQSAYKPALPTAADRQAARQFLAFKRRQSDDPKQAEVPVPNPSRQGSSNPDHILYGEQAG